MGYKTIMDTTVNRSVYNKSRKIYLDNIGEIKCAICPYHKKENGDSKFYGIKSSWDLKYLSSNIRFIPNIKDESRIIGVRFPNWKLVSKNRKQWMKKPMKTRTIYYKYFNNYIEWEF